MEAKINRDEVQTYIDKSILDKNIIYRLAHREHPNSQLWKTVDDISETNVLEFYKLRNLGNAKTWNNSKDHQIVAYWYFSINS